MRREGIPRLQISEQNNSSSRSSWRTTSNRATTVNLCTNPLGNFALRGVDVVAYFSLEEDEGAVLGSTEFASTFSGYRFLFVSAENKALFEARQHASALGSHTAVPPIAFHDDAAF